RQIDEGPQPRGRAACRESWWRRKPDAPEAPCRLAACELSKGLPLVLGQERARPRSPLRCQESGVPPVESALRLCRSQLPASERHRLENFLVLEVRLHIRPFGLGASWLCRSGCFSILTIAVHFNSNNFSSIRFASSCRRRHCPY